jgi:hypothetical protein
MNENCIVSCIQTYDEVLNSFYFKNKKLIKIFFYGNTQSLSVVVKMIIFQRKDSTQQQHNIGKPFLSFPPKLRFIHTYNVTQWGTQNMGVKQQLFNI